MRPVWIIALVVAVLVSSARAQDEVKPDQLKKMYDNAVVQLKDAQDRKNELAMENEKLKTKLADLEKQLDAAHADQATFAERTYQLRAAHAAWEVFVSRYPKLLGQWQAYLQANILDNPSLPVWDDDFKTPPTVRK
jgi:septal ring factor EnvC (AmiA/AmiB activator)